jgi:hypothetical protein
MAQLHIWLVLVPAATGSITWLWLKGPLVTTVQR